MIVDRYALPARLLHWLMAIGFVFMWACGYTMTTLVEEDSALEEFLYDAHISIGVTLLALFVVRFLVRYTFELPPLPDTLTAFETYASRIVHVVLYILPSLVITAGWAETNLGGHVVKWFGVAMPTLFPTGGGHVAEFTEELSEALHKWLAYSMLAVAFVHVVAALKHRFVNRDEVFKRMWFGK